MLRLFIAETSTDDSCGSARVVGRISAKRLSAGFMSAVFAIVADDEPILVVKAKPFTSARATGRKAQTEAAAMRLGKLLCASAAVPTVVDVVSRPEDTPIGRELLVMTYVAGETLDVVTEREGGDDPLVQEADRLSSAADAGALMPRCGDASLRQGCWSERGDAKEKVTEHTLVAVHPHGHAFSFALVTIEMNAMGFGTLTGCIGMFGETGDAPTRDDFCVVPFLWDDPAEKPTGALETGRRRIQYYAELALAPINDDMVFDPEVRKCAQRGLAFAAPGGGLDALVIDDSLPTALDHYDLHEGTTRQCW